MSKVPSLAARAWRGLLQFLAFMALLIFLPAWSLAYWQGWLYWCVFTACCAAMTAILLRRDPALVERRLNVGPNAEREPAQKRIQLFAGVGVCAIFVVSALDHGLGWSDPPTSIVVAGEFLTVAGFLVMYRAFRENTFASSIVEIGEGQRVIATGPYALVRHPMYSGALLLFLGTPPALASWWGLLPVALLAALLVARLRDEERFLLRNLAGYGDYRAKVPFRLVPGLW